MMKEVPELTQRLLEAVPVEPTPPQPEPQQSAVEWVMKILLAREPDSMCFPEDKALELARRCDEAEKLSLVIAKDLFDTLNRNNNYLAQLADAQAEATRLREALRALSRLGTGPCGGGGSLNAYSQGMQECEAKVRKIARAALKDGQP